MKKIKFLFFAVAFAVAQLCCAVIAYPGWIDFKQPDGTIVKIRLHGSEFVKWAESEDGYTLLYDSHGNLVFADIDSNGDLKPTDMLAVNVDERTVNVRMRLQTIDKKLAFSSRQVNMLNQAVEARRRTIASLSDSKKPVVGTRKMLLILVDFQDYKFQKTKQDFEMLMNQLDYTSGGRYGSVRDFYRENSFGKLDLTTDVAGVYHLANVRAYYGGNNGLGQDLRPHEMALEAVTMADADVNYADYDNDGDGTVDGVHIIYAGPGEEAGGGSDCIWAHSWSISARLDGKMINKYSCSPEIRGSRGSNITHIGVICHELGHVLGCMDFYDTNYKTGGQYEGTGNWDLMASGNWNGDGACPAHFNPYVKIYDFGWAEPKMFNEATYVTLYPKSEEGFVRINTQTEDEYFLVEYRSKNGFDSCIPGNGLMIYRASEGLSRYYSNSINAKHRQQFYPLCANSEFSIPNEIPESYGNVNSPSTPFPGTLNVKELTDYSKPGMINWNGAPTDLSITEIEEDAENRYVTFNYAGCTDAYSFVVSETTESSVALSWKMKKNVIVMLAVSKEPIFGTPENRLYNIGETINGGGSVIYLGNGLSYIHNNLDERNLYYYKLFCYDEIKDKWISVNTREARTVVGVMHTKIFREDFSSGIMNSNWKQEHIIGNTDWKVDSLFENDDKMLIFCAYDNKDYANQKTRIILPQFDFSGMKCAMLSFKFLNKLRDMEIDYRLSPDGPWNNLANIESSYEDGMPYVEEILNDTSVVYIKLPQLTSTYEISFVADYVRRGDGTSYVIGEYDLALIDNLKIDADYDVFILTEKPKFVANNTAEFHCTAYSGILTYSECGVQWSTDSKSWINVPMNDEDVVLLEDLPKNTHIYYRAYAVLPLNKMAYGEIKSFTTLGFEKGKGTSDAPFVISGEQDWELLKSTIQNGNDCSGLFFVLGNSFIMNPSKNDINGTFNGYFDGNGFTLTMQGNLEPLFVTLGENSVVTDLNIEADGIETPKFSDRFSTISYYNLGTISKCSVRLSNLIPLKEKISLGGLCYMNYGCILSCKSEIEAKSIRMDCGGICNVNYNIIADCVFNGKLVANNNYSLGGIAELNSNSSRGSNDLHGKIYNCINNATLEAYELNGDSQSGSMGGICSLNYAVIDGCINKGSLNILVGGTLAGGICSSMGGNAKVSNCYNLGNISAKRVERNHSSVSIGGIVGSISGRDLYINNCYSSSEIFTEQYIYSEVHEIIGHYRDQCTVRNCFYTGVYTDAHAEKCTKEELSSQNIIDRLNMFENTNTWILVDDHPILKHEQTGVTVLFGDTFSSSDSEIIIPWICTGDKVLECGIQWKEEGTNSWNYIKKDKDIAQKTVLNDLPSSFPVEVRIYAVTLDESVIYSGIERLATQFSSIGDKKDPHLISDYSDLLAFNNLVWNGYYFAGEIVKLTCDIDLKGNKGIFWNPIRSRYNDGTFDGENDGFNGEFDGDGHSISNMYIKTNSGCAGFFANVDGYIHDLTIVESNIVSNALPNDNNGFVGVGGIVGVGLYNDIFPCVVERCGFTGTISGGNPVGGIMGTGYMGAVNDCYVVGSINYTNSNGEIVVNNGVVVAEGLFMGGIIGIGSADGCYFQGNITSIEESENITSGPISGKYIGSDNERNNNCFYNLFSDYKFSNYSDDEMLDLYVMQSDLFLEKLRDSIWVRADHVNDSLPIIASCGDSRVTTFEAYNNYYGDVVLSGIYYQGIDSVYRVHGFKWFTTNTGEIALKDIVSEDFSNPYTCILPNNSIGSTEINYIAYSALNNDTLWGEWKSFNSNVITPQVYIMSVVSRERDLSEVCYSVNKGTYALNECVLTYYPKNEPQYARQINIDPDLSRFIIKGINNDTWYECFITIKTDSGFKYESNKFEWFHQSQSDVYKITYMIDGNVFAVVPLRSGEKIVPIEVPEIDGYEFSGWDIPYEYMPEKDIVVYGTYISTDIEMPSEDERLVDVYAVDGRRVMSRTTMAEARKTLPKGIYIIERRKFLIR